MKKGVCRNCGDEAWGSEFCSSKCNSIWLRENKDEGEGEDE